MPRGGFRPNSGPAKGTKYKPTIEKERAREALRTIVLREMDALVQAQIANAKGVSHFFLRDPKSGQFMRIEDPQKIEAALNSGDEGSYYWIFTKDPSIQAFTDLMNRALDKPKEQDQEIHVSGEIDLIATKLVDARKRRAKRIIDVKPVRAALPAAQDQDVPTEES